MDIVIRSGAEEAELTVTGHGPRTTVGELLAGEGQRRPPAVVFVDGRAVPANCPLGRAGLVDGSVVDTRPPGGAGDDDHPDGDDDHGVGVGVDLVVLAGPGAGRRRRLAPGHLRIGAALAGDGPELGEGSVARPSLELTVDTTGGVVLAAGAAELDGAVITQDTTWTAGAVVTVDGRALALAPAERGVIAASGRAGLDGGRRTHHRPPRPAPEPEPPPLAVPDGARHDESTRRFPLLALVAPLPVAAGIAVVLGEWRFMLFGLLSPIMLLANWVEERRTRRRDRLGATRANAAASESLRTAAREHHAADLTRARHAQPTVAEAVAVVARGDPCLWERRPDHLDAYAATVATGKRPWRPPVVSSPRAVPGADEILRAVGPLAGVPISADLRAGGIGVAGDAEAARAAARGILMNTVTLHGPADLDVLVCTSPENPQAWEWAKWLPHSRIHGPPGVLASTQNARAWSAAVGSENTTAADRSTPRRLTLVVADGERWWRDRDAPLRHLLGAANVAVLAIAGEADRLPATCATVLTLDCDGAATLETAADGAGSTDVIAPLLDVELATVTARRMARLDDPERPVRSATAIPDHVSILDVLDLPRPTADGIRARWFGRADTASLSVPIGVDADGPIVVDLVADGPHGLVAGTTGSGKSELLRTIVLALASTVSPDELNVALIDFKGGAAFDACADLPHTVSLVTDLDEHLAARLLRSLGAELTRREQVLRDAGASTIGDLTGGPISLPRLLLVVDEFALLAAELPAFVPSLVDIAQRGRSLGLHLLLATQRPAGIVDNKIRANTNLRIALRVQDDSDSVDVVGTRDAAALPRRTPGRAVARLGAGELIILQTAWSSGVRQSGPGRGVVVRPFVANRAPTTLERRLRRAPVTPPVAAGATTDIVRLARAIDRAAAEVGQQHQRRPYVDPLPAVVPLDELLAAHRPGGSGGVPLALADRPDQQCHEVRCWHPGPRGSLAIHGIAGAGTSTALVTLALALAACHPPEDTHLYVIDADANLLAPLDALPHTGAVVGLDDPSRLDRLFRHLTGELTRRRRLAGELGGPAAVAAQEPTIVLLVDNVGALRQAAESEPALGEVWAALELVVRDGRPLGVCVVLTAAHERALPATLAAAIPDRLVMRAADRHAYTAFGIRPSDVPTMGPGRALDPSGPVEMQIAAPPTDLLAAVAALAAAHGDDGVGAAASRQPRRIEPLPDRATLQPLLALATRRDGVLRLPVGIDTRDGSPAGLHVRSGSTVLVLGSAGSGRSTLLATLAASAHAADPSLHLFAVAPGPGRPAFAVPVRVPAGADDVGDWVDDVLGHGGDRLVLVDDGDELGGASFERLATARNGTITFVLAGTAEGLRSVTHWSRPLLRTRTGVLLRAGPADGDLLRVQLPARLPRAALGNGFAVDDGEVVPVLLAVPTHR